MKMYLKLALKMVGYLFLLVFCQAMAGFVFGIAVVMTYGPKTAQSVVVDIMTRNAMILGVIGTALCVLIIALIYTSRRHSFVSVCRFRKVSGGRFAAVAVAACGLSGLTGVLVALGQGAFKDYGKIAEMIQAAVSTPVGLVCVVFLGPVLEELFFRGVLFNELRSKMPVVAAAFIQAILFGVVHGNLLQGIYAAVLGLVLAGVYVWTDSILACMVFHVAFNGFGSVLQMLPENPLAFGVVGALGTAAVIWGLVYLARNRVQAVVLEVVETLETVEEQAV